MRRAASVPNVDDPGALVQLAGDIESAGWEGFFVWDGIQHFASERWATVDPWVLLGAVAMATERMLVGTGITAVCRRAPWKLAKEVVTLDHLSGGRAVLGVGLGNPPEDEFAAFGDTSTLAQRAARTDEALGLIDRFLKGDPVDHDGEHYRVRAHLRPAALQSPRPPIWAAATIPHRRPLARAARWDGVFCNWNPETEAPLTPEEVKDYAGGLSAKGLEVVSFRHPDHQAVEYEDTGVTWLVDMGWPDGEGWLDRFRDHLLSTAPDL